MTERIDNVLTNMLDFICKNPLIFVSETDIHTLVMAELMKEIPEIGSKKLYKTNATIGINKQKVISKEKYKTMALHKEYGHNRNKGVKAGARSDIVILNTGDIEMIDDPLNLKAKGKWIVPDYIFEFGTEKAAKSKDIFRDHLENDLGKTAISREKGYVIHIQRNLCKSKGGKLSANKNKYEGYADVIKQQLGKKGPNQRLLIILVEIGNEGRKISKEGKTKIFMNDRFVPVNANEVKKKIIDILK